MRWGLMKKKNPTQELIISNIDDADIDIDIEDRPSSSTIFSFSNLLPVSSWLSKLKQNPKPKQPPKPAPTPAPTPKPLLSPPPAAPRRLSLDGDDASRFPRHRHRHLSLGSELEFRPETHHRRPRRQKPKNLKPIKTNSNPDPDPIRPGRKSFQRIRPRVRVYSPRLNPNPNPNPKALESFAVVKKSSDPVKDFRESMVEMILERRIGRPEELEGLLACYLELNSDEHHDVIVKVFRQVWFELNRVLDPVRCRRG